MRHNKTLAVSSAVLTTLLFAFKATTNVNAQDEKIQNYLKKEVKYEKTNTTNKNYYNTYKAIQAKTEYSKKIAETINVNPTIIEYAFEEAELYVDTSNTMNEYYEIVSVILATMDIESSFEHNTTCSNTNKTTDYGIMQVNSVTIKDIKLKLGDSVSNYKEDIKHNIKAGTYEAMLCWNKAKKVHPEDVPFHSYAYYNRGLWYEQKPFNKAQRDKRSNIFKSKYFKYYDMILKYELIQF